MSDNLVNDMNPEMRQKYMRLKDMNEHMLRQLESGQQELDVLNSKIDGLQEELSMSQVKQEAVRLYEQLNELEMKRDSLIEEAKSTTSPAEEREKLLKQVKEDNQEIAIMERQTNEFREKIESLQEEIQQLDMDIEENQGERNQKYKELKKREETMDEFLQTFEESKNMEFQRISELEQTVVSVLEHIGRNMGRFSALPSQNELKEMKEDLAFKEGEMKKSEYTSLGLAQEHDKLRQDLEKVEQLEDKINTELVVQREKIATMQRELDQYRDLDTLKRNSEEKKQKLQQDRINLQRRKETFKKQLQILTAKYEGLKSTLNENETYAQLGNLERKWQHHEQNNYVMKDFINAKTMECNYRPISLRVFSAVSEYNNLIQTHMSTNPGM